MAHLVELVKNLSLIPSTHKNNLPPPVVTLAPGDLIASSGL